VAVLFNHFLGSATESSDVSGAIRLAMPARLVEAFHFDQRPAPGERLIDDSARGMLQAPPHAFMHSFEECLVG